jgi:hypothetical protein
MQQRDNIMKFENYLLKESTEVWSKKQREKELAMPSSERVKNIEKQEQYIQEQRSK